MIIRDIRKPARYRSVITVLAVFWISAVAVSAAQQTPIQISYMVRVASTTEQLLHVTTEIRNIRQPQLDLSLPVWTPGWYTIEDYGKNILRFRITDLKNNPVAYTRVRKQTWRIDTKRVDAIKVDFDYFADTLALNQAKITADYAFFTGTQLFLMAEGRRSTPATVKFVMPDGWKIISALKETSDPLVFSAPNYDALVDSPTEIGKFDLLKFEVEGKPHYLVATPANTFPKETAEKFTQMLARVAAAESAIFGGLPYEKYVYFYFFSRPESNASGALEHSNSFVSFAPPGPFATPERMIGTAAHEFFHLWNVKRIRPAEMWPYDYSRENETPLLWVSEGFTNYYGELAVYRAGLESREQFLAAVAEAASGVEGNEVRKYISPAEASVSTWLGYDTPVAFGISYYTQGQNLAALLDLSIRHDSHGAASLDDVMRALYREAYQAGRGFTADQFVAIVSRLANKSYSDFFKRYVWGTEVPPYDTILGYAGYRLEKGSRQAPSIGLLISMVPQGALVTRVETGSAAADAGISDGDVLMSIDDVEVRRRFPGVRDRLIENAGKPVRVVYKRAGQEATADMTVRMSDELLYRLVEVAQPSSEQLKLREAWLKR